jgi:hypothetical protein
MIEEIGRQVKMHALDSDALDALVLQAIMEPRAPAKRRRAGASV